MPVQRAIFQKAENVWRMMSADASTHPVNSTALRPAQGWVSLRLPQVDLSRVMAQLSGGG
jgi:hypothetical protein